MTDDISSILAFAEELADISRNIVQQHLRQGFETEIKGDGSPVTVVDRHQGSTRAFVGRVSEA